MKLDLEGKAALVTGDTAGIGLAIASELTATGATVFITGRSREKIEAAIASISSSARERVRSVAADSGTAVGANGPSLFEVAEEDRVDEWATVKLSLLVQHKKDAKYDHQKRPEPCEHHLPASGQFRQPFENANTESGGCETKVLRLDASHDGHMLGAVHPAIVLVKQEHHGTTESQQRENPCGPGRFQNAAGALQLEEAQSKENHGKGFVLQILEIVGETVPPGLRTERP